MRLGVATIAALTLVSFGGAASLAGTPPAKRQNGLIAAVWQNSVYLVAPDGSRHRRIPRTAGATDVAWAPDGSRLAFAKEDLTTPEGGLAVYTVEPDGSDLRLVLRNAMQPSWSPDGEQLAVARDTCADPSAEVADCRLDVYTVSAGGGDLRRVGIGFEPSWSPDGEWIAFSDGGGISTVRPDGSDRRPILRDETASSPAWSSDGSKLAVDVFLEEPVAAIGIAVVEVETGLRVNVTSPGRRYFAAAWSPDGTKLAFLAAKGGAMEGGCMAHEDWQLWVADATGTSPQRLAKRSYGPPSWGPAVSYLPGSSTR